MLKPIDPLLGLGPWGSAIDTIPSGAREQEWFLEGEATRYRLVGNYSFNGRWNVEPAEKVPYRTRILVEHPSPDRFNGIVVCIWNNVSAGFDGTFAGVPVATMLEDGYALIGVSAQYVGVHGERGLVVSDSERYGVLSHPGDNFSYDIFTQAVRFAVKPDNAEGGVLNGLAIRHVVASGASQSASRLATLYNALHPAQLIDAYHLPLFFGNGTVVDSTDGERAVPGGSPNWPMRMLPYGIHGLRDDLGVPVFILNSESEAYVTTVSQLPDSEHLVLWENAGSSHVSSTTGEGRFGLPNTRCRASFAPAQRAVWHHLRRWLEEGVHPPSQPRLERTADGRQLARDEHGNALGGIRWPHVVVPLGTHRAEAPSQGRPDLMGTTTAFEPEKVRRLYPTREQYEARFMDAVVDLVASGVVLPEDASSVSDPLAAAAWG